MHEAIASELRAINQRLDRVERLLSLIAHGEANIMTTQADIDQKVQTLNAQLKADTDAENAVVTLLGGVKTQLDAVKAELAAANPKLDLSALDALGASLNKNAADLAAAVVANTPAADPAPPAPTPAT